MTGRFRLVVALCVFSLSACGKSSPAPTSPAGTGVIGEAAADGSTLKVTAPTPVSPINGQKPEEFLLVINNAATKFSSPVALTYRFEIYNGGGALVHTGFSGSGSGGTTSYAPEADLEGEKPYQWRARAEYQGAGGPWSEQASFVAPTTTGYIRGSEVYDPLTQGKTVGDIHGPVTFIPGVGVKLLSPDAYISYQLQTLSQGEYSLLATNLSVINDTEDPKWKIMTMREGDAALNDNIYRMSVDKRGNGAIAWRFISGDNSSGSYIETVGSERQVYPFHENLTYFVKATWRGQRFNVQFVEGGVNGTEIYNFGKSYDGIYQPLPHMAFVGFPYAPGDRGEPSSVSDMIVRQVWISSRPRPAHANK